MLQIIIAIVGIVLLFKKTTKISKNRVLKRPNSIIFGILLIVATLWITPLLPDDNEFPSVIFYVALVLIAFFMSKKGAQG